jgi:hypothetical protein
VVEGVGRRGGGAGADQPAVALAVVAESRARDLVSRPLFLDRPGNLLEGVFETIQHLLQ